MKIAIAERDGAVARVLRGGLIKGLDEVSEARSAATLQAVLDRDDLSVLILDWTFPEFDGPQICQRVRHRDQNQPYVFVLALLPVADDPHARLEAFAAGADAIVSLPCDPIEVAARLDVARRITDREERFRSRSEALEQIRRDLETENATLSEIASCDALTGLRNRRYFCEALDAQFSLARRKGLPLSLVMIDVDQFKPFNDRYGHLAGDAVLQVVGAILRDCVRDHDVVARYGGEEFAILLPATEENESLPLVDRLRLAVANHPWSLRPVTISLGVATLGPIEAQPSDLIDQADRSLYYSKAMGRNRATHARELPELMASPLQDRLGKEALFAGTVGSAPFPVADNTTFPSP